MKVIGETDIDTIPPVCQFNVYLHETVSPDKLHPIMTKLIDRGYVIVRAVKNNGYLYLFMAQAHSTFCLERYTGDQCKSHFKPSLHEEEVV